MSDAPTVASVRVLGSVHAVATDGSLIDLPSAGQRRLVAILALHAPRRLRSEWLADALGIRPSALRTSVSRVRARVGADMLETTGSGYALVGAVDASHFCQAVADAADADADDRVYALQQALALWAGPALEEFVGEEWAAGEIARLTEIHAGTVDDLADELTAARRSVDAIALLESQIARHPYRDRSRGLLIRALASEGRQADALRAFQRYRSLLRNELGTDPSPEVVRIERRVATGWDGLDAEDPAGATGPNHLAPDVVAMPLPSRLADPTPFVGRAEPLAVLASELALVREPSLRCVVLGGEAGIGKTALLAAFARASVSSEAANVVYGCCDETGVSLQPFRTVLAACVDHTPVTILAEHVARHGGELLRICPSLAAFVATTPAPTESDDATERFLTFEAVSDLLHRIAAVRPLIVLLDDFQWAEPTALLLLRHLARALADAPVLLVLSFRDPADQKSDDLRAALVDLDRADARRLRLDGFDDNELRDLVSATSTLAGGSDAQELVDVLRAQTAGNPLYASQLIRDWTENGYERPSAAPAPGAVPPSLRNVVWHRVNALGEAATEALTAASVLGVEFYEDVLVEMLSPAAPTVVRETLDHAARTGLLIESGSARPSRQFVHALVANTLYADIGPSRRAHLHGLAARALERNVDELPAGVVVQLARHYALAGRPADARRWSVRAGDDALEHLAPAEAARHYRVALDIAVELDRPESERGDLLVRLGDAQHRAGDPLAFETLQEGARLARHSGAHDVVVRAAFAADRGFMLLDNRAQEYLALVETALAVADPADTATFVRLRALLAQSLIYTPDAGRRLAAAHEALELATEHGDPTLLVQIAPAVLHGLWAPGRRELRTRVAADAIRAAESCGDPRLAFAAYQSAYLVAVESGDHVVAARSLARLRSAVLGLSEPRLQWTLGIYEAFEAMMTGRLEEAETLATTNLELGMEIGETDAFTFFASQVFVIGTFAGRHAELLPLVEQAARDSPGVVPFKLSYAIACAAVGQNEVAHEVLTEGLTTRFREISVDNIWMTSVLGYAVLAIELADVEAAAQLLPLIEPFVTDVAFNGVTSQGPVAAYAGKLASLLGQYDVAEEHLLAALDIATAFRWAYHRATTLFALAQNRFRATTALDAESEAWLGEASTLCGDYGFRSWATQIDALARLNAP